MTTISKTQAAILNRNCSEPGCHAEAQAAIAALEPETVREDALREAAAAVCPKAIKNYGIMKPGKPDKYASREAQIVIKGFARLIQEDILALIEKDKTNG